MGERERAGVPLLGCRTSRLRTGTRWRPSTSTWSNARAPRLRRRPVAAGCSPSGRARLVARRTTPSCARRGAPPAARWRAPRPARGRRAARWFRGAAGARPSVAPGAPAPGVDGLIVQHARGPARAVARGSPLHASTQMARDSRGAVGARWARPSLARRAHPGAVPAAQALEPTDPARALGSAAAMRRISGGVHGHTRRRGWAVRWSEAAGARSAPPPASPRAGCRRRCLRGPGRRRTPTIGRSPPSAHPCGVALPSRPASAPSRSRVLAQEPRCVYVSTLAYRGRGRRGGAGRRRSPPRTSRRRGARESRRAGSRSPTRARRQVFARAQDEEHDGDQVRDARLRHQTYVRWSAPRAARRVRRHASSRRRRRGSAARPVACARLLSRRRASRLVRRRRRRARLWRLSMSHGGDEGSRTRTVAASSSASAPRRSAWRLASTALCRGNSRRARRRLRRRCWLVDAP